MSSQNDLEVYKQTIKNEIVNLINNSQLNEAEKLISEYERIIKNDIEIYHAKSILYINEGKYELAESTLKEAVHLDNKNWDTYYNLGHLLNLKNKIKDSYNYYQLAKQHCPEPIFTREIEDILKDLFVKYSNELVDNRLIDIKKPKKVLVIAHIFPPIGGSGVQRTLKFVKYLRSFGWEPIIVTAGKTYYPLIDESLLAEVPEGVRVIRIDEDYTVNSKIISEVHAIFEKMKVAEEVFEPYRQFSVSNIEAYQIPDPYILWANKVLKELKHYIDVSDIELIYTTSGPYSDHIIGYCLKDEHQKPWVADFRDEWTNNPLSNLDKNSWLYKINYALEYKIVHAADKVVSVTPYSAENYKEIFNLTSEKVLTITNGYDEDDFDGILISNKSNKEFTIIHNGLLYGDRFPKSFLIALKNLIRDKKIDENNLKIYFSWIDNKEEWVKIINDLDLNNIIEFFGYVSHKESLERAAKADLLLLIVGPGEKYKSTYTGKVFEYLRLQKRILSLAPLNGEVDHLIKSTDRGYNVDFDDVEGIENSLLTAYNGWLNEGKTQYLNDTGIQQFERRNLTKQLTEVFNTLVQKKHNNDSKVKMVFFSIKNGDNFLHDIIFELSKEYNVRKIIVTDYSQIDEGMKWADICWFEWCDQLIAYASRHSLAKEKRIICRIHRYEAFTENPKGVNWNNVDKIIFVSKHIQEYVNSKIGLPLEKCLVIPNGVNQKRFNFKNRQRGYNLAVLGHINMRKNPMLILQHFKELFKIDNNYKLYFAGDFSGDLENGTLEWYLKYMVNKLDLQSNVFFDGFIENKNLPQWLEDKNYILTGSIAEGHPVGIMEAMSCGLKPVIHGYPGVEDSYPQKYIYYGLQDFIRIITSEDYNSYEYKDYISEKFLLEKQINMIMEVLDELQPQQDFSNCINIDSEAKEANPDTNQVREFYDDFLSYLKNDRERPNKRHEYIKNRLKQIVKKKDRVLDLGCGIGITTEFISKLGVEKVVGVDLSPNLIQYARETINDVEFLIEDITQLELDEEFDVIALCDVIEHIPRKSYPDLFNVIRRHLKEDGRAFISIPDPDYNDFVRKHKPEKMQIIDNSVTFDEISSLCNKNGLKVMNFNVYGIWLPSEYNEYLLMHKDSGKHIWEEFYINRR